jgi:DNA-binding NtrC family response regulator
VRPGDIPVLVERFLADAARELKVPRHTVAPAAMTKLQGYAFPGNIRELRNLIERACILARGDVIVASDFPLGGAAGDDAGAGAEGDDPVRRCARSMPLPVDLRELMDEIEKALLVRALADAGGVQAEAARRLNLSRGDVGYKLRKYGLAPDGAAE